MHSRLHSSRTVGHDRLRWDYVNKKLILKDFLLILASGSRYRQELLGRLGLPFQSWSPDIDEGARTGEAPRETAIRLARSKAQAAASRFPTAWIVGSDQVAECAGLPIGKPGNRDAARAQLRAMRGRTVRFHTALCLLEAASGKAGERLVTTEVDFRALGDAEIERYLDREPAFDCAGSAKSEGLGIALLSRLSGDDPTALVGLPLIELSAMLRAAGIPVP
jgi:septum formation protein